jgi:YD repeat-containing protein
VSSENPLGAIATQVYNVLQQLVARVDPMGDRTSYSYDAVGRRTGTTNPLGYINTSVTASRAAPLAGRPHGLLNLLSRHDPSRNPAEDRSPDSRTRISRENA